MAYAVEFKPRALKDLRRIAERERRRLFAKIENLENNLAGDVKKLTGVTPEYRLRVGDYRVLFDIEGTKVVIYRVRHRKEAYR
jgi:mRNA interferase RelE/StbE